MGRAKFQTYKGGDGQYYFRLVAENGEKLLRSEGYSSKAGCENGIASVKENASQDGRYRKETSSDGQYYFNLAAANGEIIGTSELYSTEGSRDAGIETVKRTAPGAVLEETA